MTRSQRIKRPMPLFFDRVQTESELLVLPSQFRQSVVRDRMGAIGRRSDGCGVHGTVIPCEIIFIWPERILRLFFALDHTKLTSLATGSGTSVIFLTDIRVRLSTLN